MFGEGLRGRRVRLKQQNTSLHKRGGLHGSPEILLLCVSQKGVHSEQSKSILDDRGLKGIDRFWEINHILLRLGFNQAIIFYMKIIISSRRIPYFMLSVFGILFYFLSYDPFMNMIFSLLPSCSS